MFAPNQEPDEVALPGQCLNFPVCLARVGIGVKGRGGGHTDYTQGKRTREKGITLPSSSMQSGPSPTYLQLFPRLPRKGLPNLESEVFICLFVCFVSAF